MNLETGQNYRRNFKNLIKVNSHRQTHFLIQYFTLYSNILDRNLLKQFGGFILKILFEKVILQLFFVVVKKFFCVIQRRRHITKYVRYRQNLRKLVTAYYYTDMNMSGEAERL